MKKGIMSVFLANMINMCMSILTNFVLPKYLSIDTYSYIKTYQLYVGVIGVIHLGYVDGMFLKYGGKELHSINKENLNINLSTFRIFQLFVTILFTLIISLFTRNYIYIIIALSVIPLNMEGYFRSLYQSIGEFKKYANLMNATTIVTFIVNFMFLFGFKIEDYRIYITAYLIINYSIWLMIEKMFKRQYTYKLKYFLFSGRELTKTIKDGILLMFGNFANSMLSSMDRWFVKTLLDMYAFAQYSFACSMETMINVAVTPITITLYNYFCRNTSKEDIIKVRDSLIVLSAFLISCAFPAKFILEVYLTKYMDASKVLFYLFAAQLFYIVVKSVYVNLYKASHQQKKYFVRLVTVIVVGFVFNIICYYLFYVKEGFAIGTLMSALVWFLLSVHDFKQYRMNIKSMIYIITVIISFLTCGYMLNAIIGFIIYCLIVIMASMILMKERVEYLITYVKDTISMK